MQIGNAAGESAVRAGFQDTPETAGRPEDLSNPRSASNDPPSRELFDEELYLQIFPDVAQAVRAGQFSSGHHHWILHGRRELFAGQRPVSPSFIVDALIANRSARPFTAGEFAIDRLFVKGPRRGPVEASHRNLQEKVRIASGAVPLSDHAASRYAAALQLAESGDINQAAKVIEECVDAANPSDVATLALAFEIIGRVRFRPGPLLVKVAGSAFTEDQYNRCVSIWVEYCCDGASEAELVGFISAIRNCREDIKPQSGNGTSPSTVARLCPFLVAAMVGAVRFPIELQWLVFDSLQDAVISEPRNPLYARVWPVLLPALHEYVDAVAVGAALGTLPGFAPLAMEFGAVLFREFLEQVVAERLLEFAASIDPEIRTDRCFRSTYLQVLQGRLAKHEIAAFLGSIQRADLAAPAVFFAAAQATLGSASRRPDDFFGTLNWLCDLLFEESRSKDVRILPQAIHLFQRELKRFTDAMIGRSQKQANRGDVAGARQLRTEVLEKGLAILRRLEDGRHKAAPIPGRSGGICRTRIVVMGSRNLPQCWQYRVQQKVEFLRMAGFDAVAIDFERTDVADILEQLCFATHLIVFRLPAFTDVLMIMLYAKALGIEVFYDIDDLIFDERHFPGSLDSYCGLISRDTHTHLAMDNPFFRIAMTAADELIVSTEPLAEVAREVLGPATRVRVHRNMIALELAAAAGLPPKHERDDSKVRIFFGSGTLAHKREFYDVVVPALARLMAKRPEVVLRLVGAFACPEELSLFSDRVDIRPSGIAYPAYLELVREADINIAVMEDSIPVDCKSELKWFEAGFFGIPSIVSPTRNYRHVLTNKKDVLFARTTAEWYRELLRLVTQPTVRREIGARAAEKIVREYTWQAGAGSLAGILDVGEGPAAPASRGRTRILFVNVYFWPQSIGGATRIVEDAVRYLSERYSDEFELYVLCADEAPESSQSYRVEQYWYGATLVTRIGVPLRPWADHEDIRVEAFVRRFIREYGIDIAHIHCVQILTASALKAVVESNVPSIVTVHDGWWLSTSQFLLTQKGEFIEPDWAGWAARELVGVDADQSERLMSRRLDLIGLLRRTDRVLAVSPSFARFYRAAGLENVDVNENGVADLPSVPVRRVRLPGARIVIGFVGGMSMHKGYDLLRSVARGSAFSNLDFLIVDHSLEFGALRRTRWGMSRVRFVGRYPQPLVHELYAEFDVLAAPSIWPESFGLVVREALLAGVPVIASDRGDVGRHIAPGVNGWVVDVGNPNALGELLARIDSGKEQIPAPSPCRNFRTPSDQAEELVAIYRALAKKTGTPNRS